MDIDLPHGWKEQFAQVAELKRLEIRDKESAIAFQRLEREQQDKQDAKKKKRKEQEAREAFLASFEQIAAFYARLDMLDTQTVSALMDNDEAMDRVRHSLNNMLDKAEALPDGRRVFKTEDGQRVFDEHGAEVSRMIIDPAIIDDSRPHWETYKADRAAEVRLRNERRDLLDYQTKLDTARERVDKGDMSKQQLDRLGDELNNAMPSSLRKKVVDDVARNDRLEPLPRGGPMPMVTDDPMRRAWVSPAPM